MEETSGNVTILDVANEAEVSVATVSRVLNGSSKVADCTRDHVRDVIDRLGFVRSRAAIQLANRRGRCDAGSSEGDQNQQELSLTFEGPWTDGERKAVSEVTARRGEGGTWVCVKTRPGTDLLFAVIDLQEEPRSVTGDTLRDLIGQLRTDEL